MYIRRNAAGEIEEVSRKATPDCAEFIDSGSPELLAFIGHKSEQGGERFDALRQSDLAFVRVLEDLIQVLMDKGVISFTDLPDAARDKLMARQSLRRRINDVGLMDGDDNGVI